VERLYIGFLVGSKNALAMPAPYELKKKSAAGGVLPSAHLVAQREANGFVNRSAV
jgi:hypothetical protein